MVWQTYELPMGSKPVTRLTLLADTYQSVHVNLPEEFKFRGEWHSHGLHRNCIPNTCSSVEDLQDRI
jgi:hypothetical protein